jgi:hypothetical protein
LVGKIEDTDGSGVRISPSLGDKMINEEKTARLEERIAKMDKHWNI